MKKIIFSLSVSAVLFVPVFAFADHNTAHTIEQLRAQIAALQGKIVLLQGGTQPAPTPPSQTPGQKDRNLSYSNVVTGDWIKQYYEPVWNALLAKPEHQRVFNNYIQTASYVYLKDAARVFVLGAGKNNVYTFENIPLSIEKTGIPAFALTNVTFTVEIPEGVKVLRATTGSLSPRATPQSGDLEGSINGNTVTWNIPTLAMAGGLYCGQADGCYKFHIETDGGATLTESSVAILKWHVRGNGGTQDTEWGQIIGAFQPVAGTSSGFNVIMPSSAIGNSVQSDLGVGSESASVKVLQGALRETGVYAGPITGYFGSQTKEAVKKFQRLTGISETGFVGPKTRCALTNQSIEECQ